jgi:alpha-tubulin suppressor-like RCC1 family protein
VLYTFGDGSAGQLGHGHDRIVFVPRAVKALQGVSVSQVACGGRFTLVLVR